MKFSTGIGIALLILLCGCRGEPEQIETVTEPTAPTAILEEVISDARIASRSMFASKPVAAAGPSAATNKHTLRNKIFKPEIIQVTDNIYVASGYAIANTAMLVGDDGIIIIDPGYTPVTASKIKSEFDKLTDKPVKAIIYTHSHPDHTGGASVFYTEGQGIEVWARDNFGSEEARNQVTGITNNFRISDTFGIGLAAIDHIGTGIGHLPSEDSAGVDTIAPTHLFGNDRRKLYISSIALELVKAPGETDDQLYIWLPEQRVIFSGDNFYQSWPNTYPLRGTARRSVRNWIASIESMVAEEPLIVVGGHTPPMSNATEVLDNYKRAMQWVYDKTIQGIERRMTPDEIVEFVALPDDLARLDYLQNYYGSIWGTVRDIYAQDMGWFDGNPLNLQNETRHAQAARIAHLLGSEYKILTQARILFQENDFYGAAMLAQHYAVLHPESPQGWQIMADALVVLGEQTFNAPARNYTLSVAQRYQQKAQDIANRASE